MGNVLEQFTYREILSQNQSWEATLKALTDLPPTVVQKLKLLNTERDQPGEILFTGCGSTYYLALSAASFWRRLTGSVCLALPASELWLYPETVFGENRERTGVRPPRFLVAISRSGETTETLRAVERYRERFGSENLVITCYPKSSLARAAKYTLVTREAGEESFARDSLIHQHVFAAAGGCMLGVRK